MIQFVSRVEGRVVLWTEAGSSKLEVSLEEVRFRNEDEVSFMLMCNVKKVIGDSSETFTVPCQASDLFGVRRRFIYRCF